MTNNTIVMAASETDNKTTTTANKLVNNSISQTSLKINR
jgi:hypothetical protein